MSIASFPYFGGQRDKLDLILPLLEVPHTGFLSTCFGSGAVELNKSRASLEIFNDKCKLVTNFYHVLRTRENELIRALKLTPWSRHEQEMADGPIELITDELERARRFYVRVWQSYNSVPSAGSGWKFSVDPDNRNVPPRAWKRAIDDLWRVADRISDAQIENKPALEVVQLYDHPSTLIFLDPPFVWETRSRKRKTYNHEMSDKDHKNLALALRQCKGKVVLCGYQNSIYADVLSDWSCVKQHEKAIPSSKAKSKQKEAGEKSKAKLERSKRIYCLWLNYDPPARQLALDLEVTA